MPSSKMVPFLLEARPGWFVQLPIIGGLNQPPRLRPLRRLRGILMGAATPSLSKALTYLANQPSQRQQSAITDH